MTEDEQKHKRKDYQKVYRLRTGNSSTSKYEKTKKGFLMRLYRNMKSRIEGVQKAKFHLYAGCSLLPKETFYEWSLASEVFHQLFEEWEQSGYERKLAPSVDRVDSFRGYELDNMEWVTMSENSRRGSLNQHYGDWRSNEASSR